MEKKYKETFIKGLSLNKDQNVNNLNYKEIEECESICHMNLV